MKLAQKRAAAAISTLANEPHPQRASKRQRLAREAVTPTPPVATIADLGIGSQQLEPCYFFLPNEPAVNRKRAGDDLLNSRPKRQRSTKQWGDDFVVYGAAEGKARLDFLTILTQRCIEGSLQPPNIYPDLCA